MSVYKRGDHFYIDYYYQGRRVREKVGLSRTLAREALAKRQAEIAEGRYFPHRAAAHLTFRQFSEKFWRLHGQTRRSGSYRYMTDFLVRYFGDKRLKDIGPAQVLELRNKLKEKCQTGTVNRYHTLLKSMFSRAKEWEDFHGDNPCSKVKMEKEPRGRLRFLSQHEIARMLEVCDSRIRPVVMCAVFTGMRRGEILGLRWENVDLENGIIYVVETKSGYSREIPISEKLFKVFEELRKKEDELNEIATAAGGGLAMTDKRFKPLRRDGKVFKIPYMTFRRCWDKTVRDAGVAYFRFHDLRHTFASWFVMKTNDLPALQRLLGHQTPQMTQRYAHLSKGYMAANMKIFDAGMLSQTVTKWSQETIRGGSGVSKMLENQAIAEVAQR